MLEEQNVIDAIIWETVNVKLFLIVPALFNKLEEEDL